MHGGKAFKCNHQTSTHFEFLGTSKNFLSLSSLYDPFFMFVYLENSKVFLPVTACQSFIYIYIAKYIQILTTFFYLNQSFENVLEKKSLEKMPRAKKKWVNRTRLVCSIQCKNQFGPVSVQDFLYRLRTDLVSVLINFAPNRTKLDQFIIN